MRRSKPSLQVDTPVGAGSQLRRSISGLAARSRAAKARWGRRCPQLVSLHADVRASVAIIGALSLVALIGSIALVADLGRGYQIKIANQRTADAAALSAATAFALAAGTSQPSALLTAEANTIANANGVATSAVQVSYLASYNGTSTSAVQVTITTPLVLTFGKLLSRAQTFDVTASAVATLSAPSRPACIIALAATSNAISLNGGTNLGAANCAVSTNGSIAVYGGSRLSAGTVSAGTSIAVGGGSLVAGTTSVIYGTTLTTEPGSTVNGPQVRKTNSVADPLSDNSAVATAFSTLAGVSAMALPSVPAGSPMTLQWYPTTMTFGPYTCTMSGGVWTCPVGTYNFSTLNVGSLKLVIPNGSTVTASGTVTVGGGGSLQIGNGPVTLTQPISIGGGASLSLGTGNHNLGAITLGGRGTVTIGNGALLVKGAITTGGGSTLNLGATASHYIDGALNLSGSVRFGSGAYYINGGFTNNTGGTLTGTDVTFITAGALNLAGGTSLELSAPSGTDVEADTTGAIDNLLLATRTTSSTILGGGSQNKYSGAVYVPRSNVNLTGGVGLTGTSDGCFTIVANSYTSASGPQTNTSCAGVTISAGGASIKLVQ